MTTAVIRPDRSFREKVEGMLGSKISPYFHCAKCSGGCFTMDLQPHGAVRAI